MENLESTEKDEIFSKRVPAGKRTYFFDVKSTRGNELYLTITESKKRFRDNGTYYYDKHKIFLYQEDFDKFLDGLAEAMGYVKANQIPLPPPTERRIDLDGTNVNYQVEVTVTEQTVTRIANIDFDDLGN